MALSAPSTELRALEALARRHDVLTSYEDTGHVERHADPEVVVSVLAAMGVPVDRVADAPAALAAPMGAPALAPPVVVGLPDEPVSVNRDDGSPPLSWVVTDVSGAQLGEGRAAASQPVVLPPLPVGFHDLEVVGAGSTARSRLLIAPPVAPSVPWLSGSWGVFAPLHAIRPPEGAPERAGHLGDVEALASVISGYGGRVVAVLPLLATFLDDDPFEYSPYQPASRRYFSELYLDPDRLPTGPAPVDLPAAPPGSDGLVDYRALARRARALVDHVRAGLPTMPVAAAGLAAYRRNNPEVEEYAAFRAAVTRSGPRPTRLEGDPGDVEHHVVVQWLMHEQLTGLRARLDQQHQALALDLPVGCHPDGYDTWARPDLYAPVSVGAPPDDFFAGGQNWGFPPMIPARAREDGYRELAACVRSGAGKARLLRIDHALGLRRLWWIPTGARADEGVYVGAPLEEQLAVLRIIAHLDACTIVGENLGTVPPEVTAALEASGIDGMHEEQFVIGDAPARRLEPVPAGAVAGINTHDMATFTGFWHGADLKDHAALGLRDPDDLAAALDERRASTTRYRRMVGRELGWSVPDEPDAVYAAAVERLVRSDADQVMITLEDLWHEPEPQNVPGTYRERPNWRRRMSRTLDRVLDGPLAADVLPVLARRDPRPSPETTEEEPPTR